MRKIGVGLGILTVLTGLALLFLPEASPLTALLVALAGAGLAVSEGAVTSGERHGSSLTFGVLLLAAGAYALISARQVSVNAAVCGLLSGLFLSVLASHRLRKIPICLIFPGALVFAIAASSAILYGTSFSQPHPFAILGTMPALATTGFFLAGAGYLRRMGQLNALWTLPATVFSGSVILVLLGFSVLLKLDAQAMESKFRLLAQDRIMALEIELSGSLSSLNALKAFYDGPQSVERSEFAVFARSLLAGASSLGSVEWIAAVKESDKDAFEAQIGDEEIPGFRIRPIGKFGDLKSGRYYPIVFSEPSAAQEKTAGLDLGSDPALLKLLKRSEENGLVQTLGLHKGGAEEWQLRMVCPVYQKTSPSESATRAERVFLGFVSVVIRLDAVINRALSQFVKAGMDFHIYDASEDARHPFLFYHTSDGKTKYPAPDPQSWRPAGGGPSYSSPIRVLGNQWIILAAPTPEFMAKERAWGAFALLTGGLLCSLFLLIALSDFAQSRKALGDANERMELEIAERKRSEELNRLASELKLQRSAAFSMMQDAVEARQKAEAAEKIAREFSDQLALSEERHRRVAQVTRDIIWDWDFAENRIVWSEGFFTHFGYDRDLARKDARPWRDTVHPADRDRVFKALETALAGREIGWSDEYRFLKADGSEAYVLARAHILRAESGKAVRMIGSITDITERKNMEKALSESEQRFRALASYAPVGIFETDAGGNCLFVNELWCRMAGLTQEEVKGVGWRKAIHPDDREKVVAEWSGTVREERPFFMECRFQSPSGQVTWVAAASVAIRDAEGKMLRYLGTVSDITVRKLAEEALKESERRLLLVLDATNEGIWDWNTKTGEVYFSPRWYESLGYAADEILYRINFWQALVHPDDLPNVQESINGHIAGSRTFYHCEYRLRTRFGTWRWSLDRGKVTERDPEGKPVRMVGTTVDITERKQAQEVLEQFNRMAVGREMRMIELKKEINDLAKSMGQAPPYDLSFVEEPGGSV
jgi:PAS domain S-box-containing protein